MYKIVYDPVCYIICKSTDLCSIINFMFTFEYKYMVIFL